MKPAAVERKLAGALSSGRTVRIERAALDDNPTRGVVRALGPDSFVLAEEFDFVPWGFTALRIGDVTDVKVAREKDDVFARVRALQKRSLPPVPDVDVSHVGALLRSASEAFGMIAIHLEKKRPDVCFLGRVAEANGKWFALRSITPDGDWEPEPSEFKLAQVTCVDFGGPYESGQALLAADGERRARSARRKKA